MHKSTYSMLFIPNLTVIVDPGLSANLNFVQNDDTANI